MNRYCETVALCPHCGIDCPAWYEERANGMFLHVVCTVHKESIEQVESDAASFRQAYEDTYEKETHHLALPATYRCNLSCTYCYSLSNSQAELPRDRTADELVAIAAGFGGSVTLVGGEPTIREDLLRIVSSIKHALGSRPLSIATNGQRLSDPASVKALKDAGLDFVFLSLNDVSYERSADIHTRKLAALRHCQTVGMPVWIQRTIDDLRQIDSLVGIIDAYRRVIFNATIRSVKPFGLSHPRRQIFVSDMLHHLSADWSSSKGANPFNRHVLVKGKKLKLCSWVNDMKRLDPIDVSYLISNGFMTTFHRGMKLDELLLMHRARSAPTAAAPAQSLGR